MVEDTALLNPRNTIIVLQGWRITVEKDWLLVVVIDILLIATLKLSCLTWQHYLGPMDRHSHSDTDNRSKYWHKGIRSTSSIGIFSSYSTISTSDAAYIIGGDGTADSVVGYIDDDWRLVGNLMNERFGHSSIAIGNQAFLIGGYFRNSK